MITIYEGGKAVAHSKNLAVINNYRRRERVEAKVVEVADCSLYILFTDGAFMKTCFASAEVLKGYILRSRWPRLAELVRINGATVDFGGAK